MLYLHKIISMCILLYALSELLSNDRSLGMHFQTSSVKHICNLRKCLYVVDQARTGPHHSLSTLLCSSAIFFTEQNNLEELQELIDKWRTVSQEAADRLLDKACDEPRPVMAQLLTHLQIDHKLIQYSVEDEGFY